MAAGGLYEPGVRVTQAPPPLGELTAVAEGLWWVRAPLPFALDHVNLWVIAEEDGWTLIDGGYGDARTQALWAGLLDGPLAGCPVRRLLVTHFHPDHLGMADWLCARTGAELLMSEREWLTGRMLQLDTSEAWLDAGEAHYRRAGMPEAVTAAARARGNAYRRGVPAVPVSHLTVRAGDEIRLGGDGWRVMIGRGHAPEQVTLHSPARGLLIAADQILPRISPNISVWASDPDADPLAEFLDSLVQYEALPEDCRVLPSHDAPFSGLHARLAALRRHHAERLGRVLELCREPATAHEVLRGLFPRIRDLHQTGFALAETLAHLNHLRHQGGLARRLGPDGAWRFERG